MLVSWVTIVGLSKDDRGVLPVCGNWCGPGHPKKNATPEPVDYVDAACKHHEECYETNGFANCECDRAFREELRIGFEKYGRPDGTCDFLRGWIPGMTTSFDLMDKYFKLSYCKQADLPSVFQRVSSLACSTHFSRSILPAKSNT